MSGMRRTVAWLLLLLLLPTGLCAQAEETAARPRYELHMSLLENEQSLLVHQQVTYLNDTGRDLRYMLFQVYANMLRRQSSLPFEGEDDPYAGGFAPGGADFVSVRLNGESCQWGMQGESECFMRVECDLAPGESAQFQFTYYLLLPEVEGLLGAGEDSWRLNAFYPALCVFDASTDDYATGAMSAVCDAYFARMSDYTVTLELPDDYRVAGFSVPENIDEQNGRISWCLQAENVREAALVLTRQKEYVYELSGVTLRVLSGSARAARAIRQTAEEALERFGEWFGVYPYDTLTVTESDCLRAGDSASGLISLNAELFAWRRQDELEEELVRQLARQWFGGWVGSNPVREPWLQATLSEYARLLFVEATEGHKAYLGQLNAQAVPSLKVTIPGGLNVDSAADRFSSRSEFQTVVLDRGIAVMHELRENMGEECFLEGVRLYVQACAGDIASIGDFAAAIDQASGRRLDEYLVGQLQTISDYAGHDVQPYD